MNTSETISARGFYGEYYGHKVRDLRKLLPALRAASDALIWTAGDSTLDNKYWFNDQRPAVGAYHDVLDPPTSKCDVTFWLNYLLQAEQPIAGVRLAAINTAVEATTLNERTFKLRPQDQFIRDNIGRDDVLVVSIGGNDIALLPMPCTVLSLMCLMCMPSPCLENGCSCGTVPVDDCCCGCGASLLSCSCAYPPCLGYFRHTFGTRIQKYIESLTSKTKPRKILVCMVYYLDEQDTPSWANGALSALGYNSNPGKVQMLIRKTFEEAISTIRIQGSEVIPVPLFNCLDGKRTEDYVARVEPSAIGGRKMAEYLLHMMEPAATTGASNQPSPAAPSTAFISGR